MGTREHKVEAYLREQVKARGGIARKWISPGHDGVTDEIVRLPHWPVGMVIAVEVKTVDGKLSSVQEREHARLRDAGVIVYTVYGEEGVDEFLKEWL